MERITPGPWQIDKFFETGGLSIATSGLVDLDTVGRFGMVRISPASLACVVCWRHALRGSFDWHLGVFLVARFGESRKVYIEDNALETQMGQLL